MDDTSSKLIKGIEAHQVFSNDYHIFKIASTRDTMYRFRYNPRTHDTEERAIFKRVQPYDKLWTFFLENIVRDRIVRGTSRVFLGERYSLIELLDKNGTGQGYKFVPKSVQNPSDSYCMYFALEKKEVL